MQRDWSGSNEEAQAKKQQRISTAVCVALLLAGGAIIAETLYSDSLWFVVGTTLAGGGMAGLLPSLLIVKSEKQKFDHRSAIIAVGAEIERAENDLSLPNEFFLNRQMTVKYHDIVQAQACRSFRNCQIVMLAGFMILVAGAGVALAPKFGLETKVTVATLSTMGTLFTGYIGRTFLNSHRSSMNELNKFFQQPLISSYLLTAERIAVQMPEEHRSRALEAIWRRAIVAADDAVKVNAKRGR